MPIKTLNRFKNASLRVKLMALFMVVSFVPVFVSSVFSLNFFYRIHIGGAKDNLLDKLDTLNLIYQKKGYDIEQTTRLTAIDNLVRINFSLGLYQPVSNYLKTVISSKQLTFLSVLDNNGALIISGNTGYFSPDQCAVLPRDLLKIAGSAGSFSGTVILDSAEFLRTEKVNSTEAIALVSVYPLLSAENILQGYVMGGYVLNDHHSENENYALLRDMKRTIAADVLMVYGNSVLSYSDNSLPSGRISLPANLDSLDYSLGSFVTFEIDRKSHIFSFVPVRIYGSGNLLLIGSGMPVSRFLSVQRQAMGALVIIALAAMAMAALSAFLISGGVSKPILQMVEATKSIVGGDFNERVKIRTNDEIGLLAKSFNSMTERLSYHRAMDNLIAGISRHFVTFQSNDADEPINTALGEVARFINADRAGVFLYSSDHESIIKAHSWNRIGLKKNTVSANEPYSPDTIPWLHANISMGEVIFVPEVKDLPVEAGKEREIWMSGDIRSLVFVPMFSGKCLRGFIGFSFLRGNNCTADRDEILKILFVCAELICSTIERRNYETSINAARRLLSNVFNAQQTMMVSIDELARVTMWNDSMTRFSGIDQKEAILKTVWETSPLLAPYKVHISGVLASRKAVHLHHELLGDNKRFCNISILPLLQDDKTGALVIIQDITEETKKDYQLQQAQKMETVRHLASGLSHDFNNAIGGIFAIVSYLKYRLSTGEYSKTDIEESLELISESSKRSIEMIRRLVSISKKSELNYMPIDLRLIIHNIVQTGKHLFDKSVEITTSIEAKHTYINGDHTQIEQMLLNLCINACHAMTIMRTDEEIQGGAISIVLSSVYVEAMRHPGGKSGRYFLIKVSDEGVGIDEATRYKIFDPFFTTKDKAHGTGMGLSMVFNTIQQHGGFIDVYSELNVGTTFNVYLPELADYGKNIKEEETDEEVLYRGKGLVFVIDDEFVMRNIFSKMLAQCGYSVVTAEDGESAIAEFKTLHTSVNLVILDISMPRMSGDKVFTKLKEIDPTVPILLTSGFSHDRRVKRIDPGQSAGFLHKPFSIFEISKAVHNILEGDSIRDEKA